MKHGNKHYMQVSRDIWKYPISDNAKLLFFWLNELEQRYTGDREQYFFHTDAELAKELGWHINTLKKAKKELRETDLIEIQKIHWIDQKTGKKSEKWVTAYTILR